MRLAPLNNDVFGLHLTPAAPSNALLASHQCKVLLAVARSHASSASADELKDPI